MELVIKHFNDLTLKELHEIYKVRTAVFVVEQNCPYQEVDDADLVSYHLYLKDEQGIQAYIRVIPKGVTMDEVSIGRVISLKRRQGLASKLLKEGIQFAKDKFNATCIEIEAQVYARTLYEKVGFKQVSEPFLEDGIEHIKMRLDL